MQLRNENGVLNEKVHSLELINSDLQSENSDLRSENTDLSEKLKYRDEEIRCLNQTLLLLSRNQYGKKSEPYVDPETVPQQLSLFNEVEQEASVVSSSDIEVEMETISYDRIKRKGRGSKEPFPDHLPRKEVVIDHRR